MSNNPMGDFLAVLHSQLSTIPAPGKVTRENMPLAYMAHDQQQAAQTAQKPVDQQTMQAQGAQVQVGTPQIDKPQVTVGKPELEEGQMGDETKTAPIKFEIGGHKVEAEEGSKTHKDLMKFLKTQGKKSAPAKADNNGNSGFMDQLADAFTKRK